MKLYRAGEASRIIIQFDRIHLHQIVGKKQTYGTIINSCSSASLMRTGSGFIRWGHVFSTICAPESEMDSFKVVIFSNSICFHSRVWRAGSMSSPWSWPS